MLDVEFTQLSDAGLVREHNEDYLGHVLPHSPSQLRSHGCLFVVADGVGGQKKGEVASRLAVESILDGFCTAKPGEAHQGLLQRLVREANTKVYEEGGANRATSGMATTVVACALRFDRAAVAHVGDSRCYLVRNRRAQAITTDHTVVAEQVRLKVISPKAAAESANRHILSRSLGNDLFVAADVKEVQVQKGDVLVLCSDGLHGAVPEEIIANLIVQNENLRMAAEKLVALANQRDGKDNVSVQLVRLRDVERTGMYRGRPYTIG